MRMLTCVKCRQQFKSRVVIDGISHRLYNRKYCLDCSPFGQHNTHTLENAGGERTCKRCGKSVGNTRRKECGTCINKGVRERRSKLIYDLVGCTCWLCSYGNEKTTPVLDFHHVFPEHKSFMINASNAGVSVARLMVELKKCVLVCSNCHREIEHGIIDNAVVINVYNKKHRELDLSCV